MEVTIDAEKFLSRIEKIQANWLASKDEEQGGANILCIPMGSAKDNEAAYSKSSATHLYLMGSEFPDSILL